MIVRIVQYVRPFWRTILTLTGLFCITAVVNQVEPFLTKRIADLLVNREQVSGNILASILGGFLLVKIFQASLNRVTWYITNLLAVHLETHLKQIGFDHLMALSMAFFNEQSSGKMMTKLDRGVNRIVTIVNNAGAHFLPSLLTAVLAFGIVLYYEWRIGVTVLIAFIPYIFINRWRFNKNSVLEKKEYKLYETHYSHFWEVLSSMSLIKSFRSEVWERKKLRTFFREYLTLRKDMEANTNRAVVGDFLLETWNWSMYAFIAYLTWQGQLSLGTMILLISLINLIRQPLWQLNWIFWEVKRAQIGARDFFRIMDVKPEVTDPETPTPLPTPLRGEIGFDHMGFTYTNAQAMVDAEAEDANHKPKKKTMGAQTVFTDLSFIAPAGKTTALVGPSGSGKTTVAALILRFFDPTTGSITLDGIDIRSFKQSDLRSIMGMVSQDAHLFADTIAENLRYAKPDATEEEMWEACKAAHAVEFLEKLPEKLNTEIGDRGVKLSGGQRQRLSLARTILANPQIIVLDEATSALDSESEMYIQQSLAKLLKGRTAIVIAHRLSTIQRADNIVVLKDQKVHESGTHQELLRLDGLYASLYKIQSGDTKKLKEWDLVG